MKRLTIFLLSFFSFLNCHCEELPRIQFNYERGYYYKEFKLKLTINESESDIFFTTNGREPAPLNAKKYISPITINTTTIIKARAFKNNQPISGTEVHTFIFPDSVIHQPKRVPLYMNNIMKNFDFEMDPKIVNNPLYKDSIVPGLISIPSIDIGIETNGFWNFYNGDVTRYASLEVIYPNNTFKSEQVYCGVKPRSHEIIKRSLRIIFQKQYGFGKFQTNLFKSAPLNKDNATDKVDNLILRAGYNDTWSSDMFVNSSSITYTKDQWYRDTQLLMTGEGVRGTFVHLYINGLYWGLYNVAERPDENFLADYFGGKSDNWYSTDYSKGSGDSTRYNYIFNELVKSDLSIDSNYFKIQQYVDLQNFTDYLILSWYAGMRDWPNNNWWAGICNFPEGKLKFLGWDCEFSFDNFSKDNLIPTDFVKSVNNDSNQILNLWYALKRNQEYMTFFADRVYKNCFNNGWLSPQNAQRTWMKLNFDIKLAIICESARWGDAYDKKPKTRDIDWNKEVSRIKEIMSRQNILLRDELIRNGVLPKINPPEGIVKEISRGKILFVSNPNNSGVIYYTLNGDDPRLSGGKINNEAKYASQNFELRIEDGFILKARIKNENDWSALLEIPVLLKNNFSELTINEIMANPTFTENENGKDFQYIELKNSSQELIDLSGIKLTGDINYTFPEYTFLLPGQHFILADDISWFTWRYGVNPQAKYIGKLKKSNGHFILLNQKGKKIFEVKYPESTDGNKGYSFVPKSGIKNFHPENPSDWENSNIIGGSPGKKFFIK